MSTQPEDLQCILCNKCTHVCPQNMVNEKFSPRGLVLQLLAEGSVDQSAIWQCLTCLSCQDVCPQSTKWVDYVRDARAEARSEEISFYCKHGNMLQSLQRMMSNESLQQNRLAWSDGLQHASEGEYFYFTGCLPYFDNMFPEINHTATAKATLKILNHAGIVPVLSNSERCCGYESLWNGDRETFLRLLRLNIETIEESGADKVVTACAECFQTLSSDYAAEIGELPFEIIHTAELFTQLLREGRLHLNSPITEPVTYHDPCRLGRYAKIYDQPRELLVAIPDIQFSEMEQVRAESLCCGVGNFSNCDANSKFLQHERFMQAKRAGAEVMVTTCPKCRIHYSCYRDGRPLEEIGDIEVKDLSQVLADALD
ncbi:MAG: (Fe-S)-binding protein [Pseudomonadales bacterium]|nr:(Fe-S)-binding protein [Pseudomonadales bacterium]MDP7359048.1 (Fe-S)-binding protein [Pseudomonadales bacterium]HJN52157.1 (Fe-S)-binding protein [Pseudomonadales bacterium]